MPPCLGRKDQTIQAHARAMEVIVTKQERINKAIEELIRQLRRGAKSGVEQSQVESTDDGVTWTLEKAS